MANFQPVRPTTLIDNIQARAYWLAVAVVLGSSLWYWTEGQLSKAECIEFRTLWNAISLGGGTLLCISIMIFSRHDGPLDQLGRLALCLLPAVLVSLYLGSYLTPLTAIKTTFCPRCKELDAAWIMLEEENWDGAIELAQRCGGNASIEARAWLGKGAASMNAQPAKCEEAQEQFAEAAKLIGNIQDPKEKTLLETTHKTYIASLAKICQEKPSAPLPTVIITIDPKSVVVGETATLTWTSTDADKCIASDAWDNKILTTGTLETTQTKAGTYFYKTTCYGEGGNTTDQAQLTVTTPPVVGLEWLGYRELQGILDFRITTDGETVEDLQTGDVSVQSGSPLNDIEVIDLKWRTQNQPICIVAVVDDSGSIKNGPSNRDGLQDIRDAIARLNKSRSTVTNLELGMVVFNENIISISPAKSDLDPNKITATGSYTHLWAGIQAGLDLAQECLADQLDRYLFVVTDGKNAWDPANPQDPNKRSTLNTVIDSAKEDQASICTVGIKSDKLDDTTVQALKDVAVGCTYRLAETTDKVGTLLDQYLTNRINSYRLFTTKNFCPLELKVRNELLPVCQ